MCQKSLRWRKALKLEGKKKWKWLLGCFLFFLFSWFLGDAGGFDTEILCLI